MKLVYLLFLLPWSLVVADDCQCTFSIDLAEVNCDAGTQDMLPFSLPPCLSQTVGNDKVQRIILTDQNFPRLSHGSFLLFPNLRHLDLSYSNIADVDQFTFDENSKLKILILSGNELTSLPALFQSSGNSLQSLTLRHNKLETVDTTNLIDLVVIDLDDNMMDEDGVTAAMSSLPNIYEVSLDSNMISKVDKNMFVNQQKIEVISLWDNQIQYIQPGSFDHLLQIQSIDLKSNMKKLTGYRTESWHFCHSLNQETLDVKLDEYKKVSQDLKIDDFTDAFCSTVSRSDSRVSASCSNENGHLSCSGNIEDLVCELREMEFSSITFFFPRDTNEVKVENFYEAASNSYFREINGKPNMTQYLSNLKLYGTKFDLATLDDYLGPATKTVTIFADTVHMSRPLVKSIKSQISIRARVVSISEDIPMTMTREQFFDHLEADQPVDSWTAVQEAITGVGNAMFSVRKQGYISVQQALQSDSVMTSKNKCSPRFFSVQEYEAEHNTSPSVFFDRVQMNLLRMAVRTLASKRTNDALALSMADHTLMKTTDPKIVNDQKTYIVAQKLIRDKEILQSHKRNVPFYSVSTMTKLAEVMYLRMSDYARNETDLMLKLDIALGRMTDMNQNFEEARLMRELYFELELEELERIWNSTDAEWNWSFNASRNMESSIQDSINKNGEEMFTNQENELKEILARAEDTVKSDQEVVNMYMGEIERYSIEAQMSLDLQRTKLNQTNAAGELVSKEKEEFDNDIQKWKEEQMRKAFFGFLKAFAAIIVGIATMQPEIAGAGIAAGAAEAATAGAEIAEIMGAIEELISALADLEDALDEMSAVGDIDFHIPDFENNLDIVLGTAVNWRGALENAYNMKNMTNKFHDIEILGQTKVASVGPATDNGVDPAGLQQAMSTYNDRGEQLIQETINFAQLLMHLADLAGELEVAKFDLEIAIEQVERAKQMLEDLKVQHDEYVEWMNQHRDDYQDKCDEFADAYNDASAASKEAFKQQIIEKFEKFKLAFEESNAKYVASMNALTGALYTKVASVQQHSMVQRSMIMNLYQDYCDGLFYFSFTGCDKKDGKVPTMSEDFGYLLEKLNDIQWDSITSQESLPNKPQIFTQHSIILEDQRAFGFNSSAQLFGPVSSLKGSGDSYFNLIDHDDYLDGGKYRVRLDKIAVNLLDDEGNLIMPEDKNDIISFGVHFPLEFNDKDELSNVYGFRAMKKYCYADYTFRKPDGSIGLHQITACEMDHEFDGASHKTSHNGVFHIIAQNIDQELMEQAAKLQVTVSGSYIAIGKDTEIE